jgi:hypothetical protein
MSCDAGDKSAENDELDAIVVEADALEVRRNADGVFGTRLTANCGTTR